MRKINEIYWLILLIALSVLISGCQKSEHINSDILNGSNWDQVAFIPHYGYIGSYNKGTERNGPSMLQLPFVYPSNINLNIQNITKIELEGETTNLNCKYFQLSEPQDHKTFTANTLLLYVMLEDIGEFSVDSLLFTLEDGSTIKKELGEFIFIVKDRNNEPPLKEELKLRGSPGPMSSYNVYTLSYQNMSNQNIEIRGITFDNRIYSKIKEIHLMDENGNTLTGNTILPEQRVYINFNMEIATNQGESMFYHYSPFLQYTINGKDKEMVAVYSPLIIQPALEDDYLLSLINN